ncbi:MAG: hypothetical protein ACOCX9_03220 [Spirochaetota bacterium]
MNRRILLLFSILICVVFCISGAFSQDANNKEQQYSLTSKDLDEDGKMLDQQVVELSKKIENVIAKYKLMTIKNIRLVPYQMTYTMGDNYIKLEKHHFTRDDLVKNRVRALRTRSIIIYTNGTTVNKIESIIIEKNYYEDTTNEVRIVDNSPTEAGTDDIIFTHIMNGNKIVNGEKLGDIKNNTAFPVRNELKREFYVPHLSYFYDAVLNVAETYYKGIKDAEQTMKEFLENSTRY